MIWIAAIGAAALFSAMVAVLVWITLDFRAFCTAEDERHAAQDNDWMGI